MCTGDGCPEILITLAEDSNPYKNHKSYVVYLCLCIWMSFLYIILFMF
jgi:hypothetical protein